MLLVVDLTVKSSAGKEGAARSRYSFFESIIARWPGSVGQGGGDNITNEPKVRDASPVDTAGSPRPSNPLDIPLLLTSLLHLVPPPPSLASATVTATLP